MRGSVNLLAARAAVTICGIRGKPGANVKMATGRASVSSMAFHMVQPLPVTVWSTSRYRPASRVPGSEVYVLIRKRQERDRLSTSFQPLKSHDHRPMVVSGARQRRRLTQGTRQAAIPLYANLGNAVHPDTPS